MSSTSPGVPGFETISVLVEGPSTIVRARSVDDGREVIVKLLDPASEPLLPKRFDRRRRTLLRLCEPGQGFTPLLDHGVAADGRPYIVLPHFPLGSLQDQLDRGPTPWFPASQLMAKVAETVGRAHDDEAPLGDIRPSKILLHGPDIPVVSVFGMATRRFDDGRPSYRAPDAGNDTLPTAPADVFSLALVLATLIAGRPKDRNEPVGSFLTELVGLAPSRIHEVLEHGLAESVTNRYGTATAMFRALTRAIGEVPDRGADDTAASAPVDLDELLAEPIEERPSAREPIVVPPTADGLPADLDDLILASTAFEDAADDAGAGGADGDEDDRLLLPPGLDDIVLAAPNAANVTGDGSTQDETTPFPPEADDLEAGADDYQPAKSAEPDDAGDHDDASDHDDADERLTIIDLTTVGQRSDRGTSAPKANGHGADGDRTDDDVDRALDDPAAEPRFPADDGIDDPFDRQADPPDAGPAEDEHEIVDLTELFTRTHEFVYDPAIHGPGNRPSDDSARSGDEPPITRPPGEPGPSPSISTTTLLRGADPVASTAPAMERAETEDEAPLLTPAPPEMPARAEDQPAEGDPTSLFPDAEVDASPPWLADDADDGHPGEDAPTFLDPDRSEAIPFPNMGRVRNRVDDHRWQARARTWAELFWFRSRRTVSTVLALLGLLAIVAIVVLFAARELRSVTTSVDTEGVPLPLTTATTSANFVSTDAPFITDVPPSFQSTTATTARRRATTTEAKTTAPPVTPSTTAATQPPTTAATTAPTPPPTTSPTTERDRRTTTTRRRRRRTTTVPTTEAATTEVLPSTTSRDEGDEDDSDREGRGSGDLIAPGLSRPTLVSLSETSASVTYSSNECVATRFRLTGTDGSVQTGNSRGYEPSIQCASAWNLDFRGSSGLSSGVGYTLTLTIKGPSGETTSGRLDFTTPA